MGGNEAIGASPALSPAWAERPMGGSPDREAQLIRRFAEQIRRVQQRNAREQGTPPRRAFHSKQHVGVTNAVFTVASDLRPERRHGMFDPGRSYPAWVRFSNASGLVRSDAEGDLRGIGVRIFVDDDGALQDILFTSAPASHARDPRQFMAAAVAMAGGRRAGALPGLVLRLGPKEATRMIRTLRRESSRPVESLATEAYWSRAPFAIGPLAARLKLEPMARAGSRAASPLAPDGLRQELAERLARGDVRFRVRVLPFLDQARTPIEDGTVAWPETEPAEVVAELTIPRQDLSTEAARMTERLVDAVQLNPWNETGGLHPIGGLNRARKLVYEASARERSRGSTPAAPPRPAP